MVSATTNLTRPLGPSPRDVVQRRQNESHHFPRCNPPADVVGALRLMLSSLLALGVVYCTISRLRTRPSGPTAAGEKWPCSDTALDHDPSGLAAAV